MAAAWKASLTGLPPKNSSERVWMPIVLEARPGVDSTVAGSNGTPVFVEPRVAMMEQPASGRLVTRTALPVEALNVLVSAEPRVLSPSAPATATAVCAAVGQITARWNGMPSSRPPPGFLVSMYTARALAPLPVYTPFGANAIPFAGSPTLARNAQVETFVENLTV